MIKDLIKKARTYRRFDESYELKREDLLNLVDSARIASSGANLQPLKYFISSEKETNALIFDNLRWAGGFKDWDGPSEGERPTGYIVMVHDTNISKNPFWDHGLAAQNILLTAIESGIGGCMFASFDKSLHEKLNLSEKHNILMVIALGKPVEEVKIVSVLEDGKTNYYRDENKTHYVPKRALEDIIL